jgi:hypothetical protein
MLPVTPQFTPVHIRNLIASNVSHVVKHKVLVAKIRDIQIPFHGFNIVGEDD